MIDGEGGVGYGVTFNEYSNSTWCQKRIKMNNIVYTYKLYSSNNQHLNHNINNSLTNKSSYSPNNRVKSDLFHSLFSPSVPFRPIHISAVCRRRNLVGLCITEPVMQTSSEN